MKFDPTIPRPRFTKLATGEWGLSGYGLVPGEAVLVARKDGTLTTVTVDLVLTQDPDGYATATIFRDRTTATSKNKKLRNYTYNAVCGCRIIEGNDCGCHF